MKAIFTIILSTIFFTSVSANNIEDLKVSISQKSSVAVKFTASKITTASIAITNQAGEIISTQKINVNTGNNIISLIDIKNLADGTYTVTVIADNNTTTTSFINLKMD